jgi:hypothetical protein
VNFEDAMRELRTSGGCTRHEIQGLEAGILALADGTVAETQAMARKWRRRGAYLIAFGVLLEAFAGADVVYSALAGRLSLVLAVNVITVASGVFIISRGLTIRHTWLWALSPFRGEPCSTPSQPASAHSRPSGSRSR